MKNHLQEFGSRLVTLHTGESGLRGGLACEVKAVADDDDCLDYIGSTNQIDRYGEVIEQDGWQLENFRANPVIPDCHDYSSIARILGRATSVSVKGGRLQNRVKFATDNPLGAMALKLARNGFIPAQSVGFIPIEWTNGIGKDQPSRTYTKCELLEISLVVVPANPEATQTMKKALNEGAIEWSDLRDCAEFFAQFKTPRAASGSPHIELLNMARSVRAALA